jgi:hypothetical protein
VTAMSMIVAITGLRAFAFFLNFLNFLKFILFFQPSFRLLSKLARACLGFINTAGVVNFKVAHIH